MSGYIEWRNRPADRRQGRHQKERNNNNLCFYEDFTIRSSFGGFKDGVRVFGEGGDGVDGKGGEGGGEWDDLLVGFVPPWEELAMLFAKYDENGFGEIGSTKMNELVKDEEFRQNVINLTNTATIHKLESIKFKNYITYQDFIDIVSNKRRRSFQIAVHQRDIRGSYHQPASKNTKIAGGGTAEPHYYTNSNYNPSQQQNSGTVLSPIVGGCSDCQSSGDGGTGSSGDSCQSYYPGGIGGDPPNLSASSALNFPQSSSTTIKIIGKMKKPIPPTLTSPRAKFAYRMAEEFLPGTDIEECKYYSLQYRCCRPPPFVIPIITLLQASLFIYYSLSSSTIPNVNGPIPIDSLLIFRTDKRVQVWRFLFYAFLHAGWWHLVFNLLVQVLVGVPLEMVHGSWRVGLIYAAGVTAGSLGTSVLDGEVYLVGGSGGVYALLAAHVANVLINYSEIDCGIFYIIISILIASMDVGFAIYNRYAAAVSSTKIDGEADRPISYVAHLAGAIAGLSLGLILLKSNNAWRHTNTPVDWMCYVSLFVYLTFISAAIVYNVYVSIT